MVQIYKKTISIFNKNCLMYMDGYPTKERATWFTTKTEHDVYRTKFCIQWLIESDSSADEEDMSHCAIKGERVCGFIYTVYTVYENWSTKSEIEINIILNSVCVI